MFRGMNIHKSQLFWGELQGYKVLTHNHMNQHKSTKQLIDPGLASESFVCFVSHFFSSMYEYKGTF